MITSEKWNKNDLRLFWTQSSVKIIRKFLTETYLHIYLNVKGYLLGQMTDIVPHHKSDNTVLHLYLNCCINNCFIRLMMNIRCLLSERSESLLASVSLLFSSCIRYQILHFQSSFYQTASWVRRFLVYS